MLPDTRTYVNLMTREVRTLTGLRGAAALLVIFYHFFEKDAYYGPYVPWLIRHGYIAVDMFFVLSGFVIALSYTHLFQGGVTLTSFRYFMAKRIARIYPLYALTIALFILKAYANVSGAGPGRVYLTDVFASLGMIQSWGFPFTPIDLAVWSISTEFFAYLVFPLLVIVVVRRSALYGAALFALSLLAICAVAYSGQGIAGQLDVVLPSSPLPLLRCMAGFCLGVVCYRASSTPLGRKLFSSSACFLAALAVLVIASSIGGPDILLFLTFPVIVLGSAMESDAARVVLANRVIYHFGVISYSLYMLHPLVVPVKARLEPVAERFVGHAAHPLTLLFSLLLAWLGSCLLYGFVERPGRSYLQHVLLPPRIGQSA